MSRTLLVQVGHLTLTKGKDDEGNMSQSYGVIVPNMADDAVLTVHDVTGIDATTAVAAFSIVEPFDPTQMYAVENPEQMVAEDSGPHLTLVPADAIPQEGDTVDADE